MYFFISIKDNYDYRPIPSLGSCSQNDGAGDPGLSSLWDINLRDCSFKALITSSSEGCFMSTLEADTL